MATPIPRSNARFSTDEILVATGGTLVREGGGLATHGVATDTREVRAGDLFVALRGERHDAHAFLAAAIEAGAAGVVVDRDVVVPDGPFVVKVEDTLRALGDLAHAYRMRLSAKVVAITGSVGKTTTKELAAAMFAALGERVHKTEGNLNNLVGLPRTLLAADPATTVVVAELGMSVPGEIARLAEIAAPDVGLVTAVAEAHTEGVGGLDGVAREKGALLTALGPHATAIATRDDAVILPYLAASPARTKLGFGRAPGASVHVETRRTQTTGSRIELVVAADSGLRPLEVETPLVGEGAARNLAAALALALALRGETVLEAAARALGTVRPPPGRMSLGPGAFGTFLLDDTYNASPRAMRNALEAAADVAQSSGGRLVAVLGDMLELGALEEELHARVGENVARVGTSMFVACGPRMRAAAEEARELGCDYVVEVDDALEAALPVRQFLAPSDVVLVKGSRSTRMERCAEALRTSAHVETPTEPEQGAA